MATTSTSTDPSASPQSQPTINIGTRRSALARVQADGVQGILQRAFPDRNYEVHAIATNLGDLDKTTPLYVMGQQGKSLWTHELEVLLLEGKLDMVVHCLKDMPTLLPENTTIAAIPPREDPRDVLVVSPKLASTHRTLASLPPGSVIGTSSVRRTAQLRRLYPHLKFLDCRGNIGTRLAKLDAEDSPFTALVLAAAGLHRLGWEDRISSYLSAKEGGMLYAVGQGALAIQIREGDKQAEKMLETIGSERTTRAALAERSLMRTLEGGCSVPIGVETEWVRKEAKPQNASDLQAIATAIASGEDALGAAAAAGDPVTAPASQTTASKVIWTEGEESELTDMLTMRAIVVSVDGKTAVEAEITEKVDSRESATVFGAQMANVLVEKGAQKILTEINFTRRNVEGS